MSLSVSIPLILVLITTLLVYNGGILLLPDSSIIHQPQTPTFIQYVGQYVPNDHIANFSIIIPMTAAYCPLIPIKAGRKIQACAYLYPRSRYRRLFFDFVNLGIATGAAAIAGRNVIKIKQIEKRMASYELSLTSYQKQVDINTATLAFVKNGTVELALELKNTQVALNDSIRVVRETKADVARLNASVGELSGDYSTFKQEMAQTLLYLSINEILSNRPNLVFIRPSDVPAVIQQIMQETNDSLDSILEDQSPLIALTQLILYQKIYFMPTTMYRSQNAEEIGRLIFTNVIGLPNQKQDKFNVYQLHHIPFYHHHHFVKIANMPSYIGQNPLTNDTIEWYSTDTSYCTFDSYIKCKNTPAYGRYFNNRCLIQVLSTNTKLSSCRYEHVEDADHYTLQLNGGYWAVSSNRTLECVLVPVMPSSDEIGELSARNVKKFIPPVSLVHVPPNSFYACADGQFNLYGIPVSSSNTSLIIISNNTLSRPDIDVFTIQKTINDTYLSNLKFIDSDIDDIIGLITQTPSPNIDIQIRNNWNQMSSSSRTFIISGTIIAAFIIILTITIIYLVKCKPCNSKQKPQQNIEINLANTSPHDKPVPEPFPAANPLLDYFYQQLLQKTQIIDNK
ncbi:unnamed protein product [Didymodactylos carnosus]|uniref:Uncharacterized protein n=1 Tax=Didymodactylos carnosus TaxID=1234261 RepID=A0A815VDN6_9BILA|nr:unnamed protein product [Didymodactylos carnosus]CAF4387976.1 unnamed protein product [Didymodactylos carnosus]